ncbi:MAG TPA: hypothetical protein VGI69_09440 [Gaiellaceae bacterium]|jgi:hypothetical protein
MNRWSSFAVLVALVLVVAGCGGSGTTAATASTATPTTTSKPIAAPSEAASIVDQCSTEMATMVTGLHVSPRCNLRGLTHLRGTIWRARLAVPPHTPTAFLCVTFDTENYVAGSRQGQSSRACPRGR